MSLLAVLGIFLIEPYVGIFYPGLKNFDKHIILLFSLALLIKPMRSISISLLDREMDYGKIAIVDGIGIITYYIIAIALAINNFNVYSFIFAVIAKEVVELCVSFYFKPIVFIPKVQIKEIRNLIKFGIFMQVGNGIQLAHDSLIPLIGGRVLNIGSIGFLDWSKSIASLTNTILDNYSRVAFSGIAKIQEDRYLVSKSINKSIEFLNIPIFLFVLLIVTYTYDFIHFVATDKWMGSAVALQIFLIGSLFLATIAAIGQALVAIGYVKEMLALSGILAAIEIVAAIILLLQYGFLGIPIAFLLHTILQFMSYLFLAKKKQIAIELRSFINCTLIFMFCYITGVILNNILPINLFSYFTKLLITTFSFSYLCFIISKSEIIELIQMARAIIPKNE